MLKKYTFAARIANGHSMFSLESFNQTVIISAYTIRRINFRYQESLKKLIIQAMKQDCNTVLVNLAGVRAIDCSAYEMLKLISGMVASLGITLSFINLDEELIVITSYSIHYTKLYEPMKKSRYTPSPHRNRN